MRASLNRSFPHRAFSFHHLSSTALVLGISIVLALAVPVARGQALAAPAASANASATAAPLMRGATPVAQETRESGGKGAQEGIQVHGHWIIEVKNPDGTVTARREFENSIQQSGMYYLASLLAGNNSPGGLSVLLNGSRTNYVTNYFNLTAFIASFHEAGPCQPLALSASNASGGPSSGTTCLITLGPNANGLSNYLGFYCISAQEAYSGSSFQAGQTYPCSTNLIAAGPIFVEGETQLPMTLAQLTGSVTVTATSPGSVKDVETLFSTCGAITAPSVCLGYLATTQGGEAPQEYPAGIGVFTERNLDGQNGDPAPVPYSPGQVINVSVTFRFQ